MLYTVTKERVADKAVSKLNTKMNEFVSILFTVSGTYVGTSTPIAGPSSAKIYKPNPPRTRGKTTVWVHIVVIYI